MRRSVLLSLLLASAAMLTGCNNSLKDENAALMEESQNLRAQLADRNEALEAANADRRELEMVNAELRRQNDALQAQANQPPPAQRTGFEGIEGVSSQFGNGMVTVTIASDILFDSGKAALKTNAKRSLDQVASVLNSQYSGRTIRIAGHTDTDPIVKSGWKTNYHLGSERAYSVMEYLKSRSVPESRMFIASFGPNRPQGSKAQSRRVEIAVMMNE